ncbi:unnamed protein product [Gadus morhua 'NCC']
MLKYIMLIKSGGKILPGSKRLESLLGTGSETLRITRQFGLNKEYDSRSGSQACLDEEDFAWMHVPIPRKPTKNCYAEDPGCRNHTASETRRSYW